MAHSLNPARQASQAPVRLRASAEMSRTCALPLRRHGLARAAAKARPRRLTKNGDAWPLGSRSITARAEAGNNDAAAASSSSSSSSSPRVAVFSAKPYVRDFLAPSLDALFPDSRFVSARLDETTAALASGCDVAVAFVNDSADAAALAELQKQGVGLVALRCAGFDCVDVEAAARLGIKVLRVPTYSPTSVAEHSVALALSLARRIPLAFDRARFQNYELSGLVGFQMKGRTVGIWGTGAIGTAAVAIYKGLGCRVLVRRRRRRRLHQSLFVFVFVESLFFTFSSTLLSAAANLSPRPFFFFYLSLSLHPNLRIPLLAFYPRTGIRQSPKSGCARGGREIRRLPGRPPAPERHPVSPCSSQRLDQAPHQRRVAQEAQTGRDDHQRVPRG